jgi:hypothetical protein
LGWKNISGVQSMVLPTTLRGAAHDVLRRRVPRFKGCAFIVPNIVPLRRLHAPIAPAGVARIEEMQPDRQFDIPGQQRNGLRALLDRVDLEWIYAAPRGLFEPIGLVFWLAGEAVGLSLSRFEPSRGSVDGRIVHLQIASPAQEIADWIIAETARWLIQRGVGFIRCRASSPQTIRALQKAGFMARAEPGFWWASDGTPPPATADLGYLHLDDTLPLYERWVRRLIGDAVRSMRQRSEPQPGVNRSAEVAEGKQ